MFSRNHVSDVERWEIGFKIYTHKGYYGEVTETARKYGVSRWFIYWCHQQFVGLLLWWEVWSKLGESSKKGSQGVEFLGRCLA
ncbi:hypothetical protein WDW89_26500 [Deltaproteobacteria bacterium TL4]